MYSEVFADMNLNEIIGKNLKELRIRKNLSQEELAKEIGISASNLREIEYGNGNPTILTIERIAEGLNITTSVLVSSDMDERDVLIRESIFSNLSFIRKLPQERQTLIIRIFEQLVLLLREEK